MWFLIDLFVDIFEKEIIDYLAIKNASKFAVILNKSFKATQKVKKTYQWVKNPIGKIKMKYKKKLTNKILPNDSKTKTILDGINEIKGWNKATPNIFKKMDTFRERFSIKWNDLVDNDTKISLDSQWADFIIWRAVNKSSPWGWLLLGVKHPSMKNPSGVYLFPPVMSLKQFWEIRKNPTGQQFCDSFYNWWRNLHPRFFLKNATKETAQKIINQSQVVNLLDRKIWDDNNFAQKIKNEISKIQSNYLLGYGKFVNNVSYFNKITKKMVAKEPQFKKLFQPNENYGQRYAKSFITKTRKRVINQRINNWQKRHPLLKKVPKKVKKGINKWYNDF